MEALTIRERILGSDNPEIPHPVIFRGAVFADSGRFDRCIALWMHAMVLRQKNSRPISKDLLRFSQVFAQMVTVMATLKFSDIEAVLKHGLTELKLFQSGCTKSECGTSSGATELYQGNILSIIYLIITSLRVIESSEESRALHKFVYDFINVKPTLKNGYSPLHIVLDPGIFVDDFHVDSVVQFPDLVISDMLIRCGADVNAYDINHNTPLHVICNAQLDRLREDLRQKLVRKLLAAGAHPDIANKRRRTPMELAGTKNMIKTTFNMYSEISLKCLAARVIQKHRLPFKGEVPACLESFIEWH